MRAAVLLLLAFLAAQACVWAAPAVRSWEFSTDGDTEGWTPLNDIRSLTVTGGVLQLEATGPDPYLYTGEADLGLDTEAIEGIEWRMRFKAGGVAQVYWITDRSGEWFGPDRKSVRCAAIGDGEWHTYRLRLDRHPGWRGRVRQIRLDPFEGVLQHPYPVRVEVDYVRLYPPDPQAAWDADLSNPIASAGAPFEVRVRIVNHSACEMPGARARLEVPGGVRLEQGGETQSLPAMAPDAAAVASWRLSALRPGVFPVRCTVVASDGSQRALVRPIHVSVPAPAATLSPPAPRAALLRLGEHVALGNDRLRLVFLGGPFGFGRTALYRRDRQRRAWALMGMARSFGRLIAGSPPSDMEVYAPTWHATPGRGQGLAFHTTVRDGSGTPWQLEFRYRVATGSDCVDVTHTATPARRASLYLFEGPTLYAGEGSFGPAKESALFPGLEFLQGAQESSSRRDFSNEWRFRMAPHPYRITVPVVSVSAGGGVIGLLWDALHRWDGTHACTGARFASPNQVTEAPAWSEYGRNHLLGLFVPSVPQWVPENHERAATPYPAEAGRPLVVKARILLASPADPLCALDRWIALHGLPDPSPLPRSPIEERELIRSCYVHTLWSDAAGGWKHLVEDKEARPNAWLELLLRLDLLGPVSSETRRALGARIARSAAHSRPGPAGFDYTGSKLPFLRGELGPEALAPLESRARDAMRSQNPDGSWGYVLLPVLPEFRDAEPLGVPGMKSVYQTAISTWTVLRYANLTGDAAALASGLRGLAYLRSGDLIVPQGSPFECPASSPYLWSSALAVDAFLEGFAATGERQYLEGARYWARTGLQFLYLWNLPGVPLQRYATIGVYGSSYGDQANWIGRPVQWIGLLYAYSLLHLAEVDRSFPWGKVARGILVSAMYQQSTDGPTKGTYPDSVDGAGDLGRPGFSLPLPAWIEPDYILMCLLAQEGLDPEVRTRIARGPGGSVHVSAPGEVRGLRVGDRGVSFEWRWRAGGSVCASVAGVGRPVEVSCEGRTLAEADELARVPSGWRYDAGRRMVYLKVALRGGFARVRVR